MYKENNIYLGNNGKEYMYVGMYYTYTRNPNVRNEENVHNYYGIFDSWRICDSNRPLKIEVKKSKRREHIFISNLRSENPRLVTGSRIRKNLNGVSYPASEKDINIAKKVIDGNIKIFNIESTPVLRDSNVGKKNIVVKNNDNNFYGLSIDVNRDGSFKAVLNGEEIPNVFNKEFLSKLAKESFEKNVKNNMNMGLGSWNPYFEVWEEAFKEMKDYLDRNNYRVVDVFYKAENSNKLYTVNKVY